MKAIIAGGSIGGLFAASALLRAGWEVAVHDRSPVPLAGRGAGIVTHPELIAALETVGAETRARGVEVHERVAYDIDGGRVAAFGFHQVVTSWDRMYQVLRALVPEGCYHLGRTATGYEETDDGVLCRFEGGGAAEGDVLVGADGFRSSIRRQMLPEVRPRYAGYVVWRALAAEADLSAGIRADVFRTFGFFLPNGTQIIGYPIAGPDNDLTPGKLRYNFVWYNDVPEAALPDMLTDAEGTHHPISIPPPLIREEVINAMYAGAQTRLPAPFNNILAVSGRPFFTPIYDHPSPVMADGRV
ncbi:MAG: FAD-dependent oxidoreductase, partial [Geminicoccaceae bacterium]